ISVMSREIDISGNDDAPGQRASDVALQRSGVSGGIRAAGSMQTGGLPKSRATGAECGAPVSMESGMFESEIRKPRSGFARLNQIKLPLWVTLVLLVVFVGLFAAREFTLEGRENRVSEERRAVAQ